MAADEIMRHTADYHKGRRDLHLEMAQVSREAWEQFGSTLDLTNAEYHDAQAKKEDEAAEKAIGIVIDEGMSIECILDKHGECKQDEECTCPCHGTELTATTIKVSDC